MKKGWLLYIGFFIYYVLAGSIFMLLYPKENSLNNYLFYGLLIFIFYSMIFACWGSPWDNTLDREEDKL